MKTAATAAGLAAATRVASGQEAPAAIPTRPIPGTDLALPVLGYGTEFMADRAIVDYLIGKGVTYIDTAPLYQEGEAERKLAPVLADHGGVLVLSTKYGREAAVDGTTEKDEWLRIFNESCERMQVEGVDILYLHDCRNPEKVASRGAYDAFLELRDAGRVKAFGMSTHMGQEACVRKAVELGWFDLLMVVWNFFSPQALTDAVKLAADEGHGIVAIKVAKGLTEGQDWYTRATDEERQILSEFEGDNLYQRSIRWTLSHDFVTGVVMSMESYDVVDQNVAAVSRPATEADARALRRFADVASAQMCRGCATCLSACPRAVAIPDILRFRSYYRAYKQVYPAIVQYHRLPREATVAACADCGACEAACPYGLPIREHLADAHALLA